MNMPNSSTKTIHSAKWHARHHRRLGLSVVELSVLLSILSMFAAIAIPMAIQAREDAREARCAANFKVLIHGVANYHRTFGMYPSNGWGFRWVGEPGRGPGRHQPGSWAYSILPHIEQQAFPMAGNPAIGGEMPGNDQLLLLPLPVLQCPARGADIMVPNDMNTRPYNATWARKVFRMDYASNEGDFHIKTGPGPKRLDLEKAHAWPDNTKATGPIFLRSEVTSRQIVDGLSNTYFLGEKYVFVADYFTIFSPGYDQCAFTGADLDTNRCAANPPSWDHTDLSNLANSGARCFGSAHPDFCWFAFGDGSVRRIAYSVDPGVHRANANRADRLSSDEIVAQNAIY